MKSELHLPSALPEDFRETAEDGLSEADAEARAKEGLTNRMPRDDGKSTARIILDNTLTLFNALNLLLAVMLICVGSYRNMLFLLIVVSNTAIAIYQEISARNTIRKLKLINAPKAKVIRDGMEREIDPADVVKGDLLVLRAGDQVVTDGVAVSGAGRAMESLLTGESDAIPKEKGNWLYSGSYLSEGKVIYQAVYVGEESYAGRLTKEMKRPKKDESGLMKEMRRLIRLASCLLIPMGAVLLIKSLWIQKEAPADAVPAAVAAMLGMIPEGLMLLTSIAMAVGVRRLAEKRVLVQTLYGIESLARVDVLCLDKTGTLTTGRMTAEACIPLSGETQESARDHMSRFLGAMDERGGTLTALRDVVAPGTETPLVIQPFSSARKMSAASFEDGTTLILGAPEYVAGENAEIRDIVRENAESGKRVVLLARAEGLIDSGRVPENRTPVALWILSDEVRDGAAEAIRYFREEGVGIRVISGDNPETVKMAARAAGIDGEAIDARELRTEEDIRDACEKYTIFGRVTPAQKQMLVRALKEAGHTVGMTGDGVNDIPAMRAADCSIAMAGGADAARHTAQLTLLDSDFTRMPEIVLEGRRVINNITRSATLFLTKTIFSFLLSLLTLILPRLYPFQPIQMSLVSTWTVGAPGFFLSLMPNHERVKGDFLKNVIRRALPGGITVAVCATLAMTMENYGWSQEICSTIATWVTGAVGVAVLLRVCLPLNATRGTVVAGAAAVFTAVGALMGKTFYLYTMNAEQMGFMGALTVFGWALYAVTFLIENKLSGDGKFAILNVKGKTIKDDPED